MSFITTPLKRVMTAALQQLTGTQDNNYKNNGEEFSLPRYTIHYVFQFLGRNDLLQCHQVCKLWHSIASDAYFGWSIMQVVPLFIYKNSDGSIVTRYHFSNPGGPRRTQGTTIPFYKVEISDAVANYANIKELKFVSRNGKVACGPVLSFEPFYYSIMPTERWSYVKSEQNIFAVIEEIHKNPRLWRCELIEHPKMPNTVTHSLILEVNIPELERLTEARKDVWWVDKVVEVAQKYNLKKIKSLINEFSSDVRLPMKMVVPQKQPNGLTLSLYKYQLDAVNWMKSIEEDVEVGFEYTLLVPWLERKSNALFDTYTKKSVPVADIEQHKKRAKPRGGILADEMGLGKTTEIISLILANPGDPSLIDPAKHVRPAEIHINTDLAKFNTNATLVLCPSHLLKQWHEEIEKHTKLPLNIVYLSNIRDVRGCTYGDIIAADIVLVAHQMIVNKNYFNMGMQNGLHNPYDSRAISGRHTRMNNYLKAIWDSSSVLKHKEPVFEHFNWKRIVVDEAHEIIDDEVYQDFFKSYSAQSWWYVTGTPFPTERSKTNLLSFLRFPKAEDEIQKWTFMDIYINNLFWRNTKESVKGEYEVPPLVEDLRLLNLTPIEKAVYKDFTVNYTDEIAEVCCTPSICRACDKMLDDRPTLSDIRKAFITTAKDRIADCKSKIKQLENSLVDYEAELKGLKKKLEERQEVLDDVKEKEKDFENRYYKSKALLEAESKVSVANNQVLTCENKISNTHSKIANNKDIIEYNTKLHAQLNELDPASYNGPDMSAALSIPQPVPKAEKTDEVAKESSDKQNDEKEETLAWSTILDMNIAQLKQELVKRGIKVDSKHRKADLQKVVKEAVKNDSKLPKTKVEEEDEDDTKTKGKRSRTSSNLDEESESGAKKKPRASKKEEEEDEEEEEEVKPRAKKDAKKAPAAKKGAKRTKKDESEEEEEEEEVKPKAKKAGKKAAAKKGAKKAKKESDDESEEEEEVNPKAKKAGKKAAAKKGAKKAKKEESEEDEAEEEVKPKAKKAAAAKKGAKKAKEDDEEEVDEETESKPITATPNKKKTVQDKINEQNLLKWLVEKEGTKLANLMVYLKQLWEENPSVKIIIFSQYPRLLDRISILLEERDIDYSLVEGNATKRNKRLNAFKARDSAMHVLLLNINQAASGTNIVEASHIILMDPILTSDATAIEAQAIARAHRQGQTEQVVVTRFIVRETKEYEAYVKHYGMASLPKDTPIDEHSTSGRPKMQRTSSLVTALATTPSMLRTSSTLSELSENSLLQ